MADLIDDLTEDDAHSGIVVKQQRFAGRLPEDIMEGNRCESQCLSHCMTEGIGRQTSHIEDCVASPLFKSIIFLNMIFVAAC